MTAYEQLNAQHITGRVAEIEKIAKEDFENEIYNIGVDGRYGDEQTVNNYFLYNDKKVPEKDKRIIFVAENIFDQAQELIDAGLPAREANEIIRNTIKNGDYLDDCNNFGEKIRYFKCKKCNRIDNCLFDNIMCYNCYENN